MIIWAILLNLRLRKTICEHVLVFAGNLQFFVLQKRVIILLHRHIFFLILIYFSKQISAQIFIQLVFFGNKSALDRNFTLSLKEDKVVFLAQFLQIWRLQILGRPPELLVIWWRISKPLISFIFNCCFFLVLIFCCSLILNLRSFYMLICRDLLLRFRG